MFMQRGTRIALVTVAVAALMVGGGAAIGGSLNSDPLAEQREEAAFTDAHRDEVDVSQSAAERTAQGEHSGTIIESHLEDETGPLVWEVKVDDGSTVWEVQIDGSTGEVVSDQPDE